MWLERYGFRKIFGVDIRRVYIEAGSLFASLRGVEADFRLDHGESLPLDDRSVDVILS